MELIKTTNYFKMGIDELLETDRYVWTKEERLLMAEGDDVIFYDDMKECEEDKENLVSYAKENGYHITKTFLTINERVAVILSKPLQ